MTPAQTNIVIGLLRDFVQVGGGALVAAFAAVTDLKTGSTAWPGWPAVTVCIITGIVAAVARAQSKVEAPVIQRGTRVRTPEQIAAQIKDREASIAAAVEVALRARGVPDVTPKRVELPPEPSVPPPVPNAGLTRVPRERDLPGGTP